MEIKHQLANSLFWLAVVHLSITIMLIKESVINSSMRNINPHPVFIVRRLWKWERVVKFKRCNQTGLLF
jgi:hypothetical protein